MLVQRKGCSPTVTEADLRDIDNALRHFHKAFSAHLAPYMKSGGHTIKYHKMSHIPDAIRRFGPLKHISSQSFEHAHAPLKHAARGGNMQVSGQTDSVQLVRQVCKRDIAKQLDTVDMGVQRKQYR